MQQQQSPERFPKIFRVIALAIVCCLSLTLAFFALSIALGMAAVMALAIIAAYVLKPQETRAAFSSLSAHIDAMRKSALDFVGIMRDIVQTMAQAASSFSSGSQDKGARSAPRTDGSDSRSSQSEGPGEQSELPAK